MRSSPSLTVARRAGTWSGSVLPKRSRELAGRSLPKASMAGAKGSNMGGVLPAPVEGAKDSTGARPRHVPAPAAHLPRARRLGPIGESPEPSRAIRTGVRLLAPAVARRVPRGIAEGGRRRGRADDTAGAAAGGGGLCAAGRPADRAGRAVAGADRDRGRELAGGAAPRA